MEIQNINDLTNLLKKIDSDRLPTGTIQLHGLAKFKDAIYKAFNVIDSPELGITLNRQEQLLSEAFQLFSPEDLSGLKKAMLTSYFTPTRLADQVNDTIIDFVREFNPATLEILEPSAGSGNFILNLNYNGNINVTALEIEKVTSQILDHNLKGKAAKNILVQNIPYENHIAPVAYDLITGNIPFGNYSVYDKALDKTHSQYYHGQIHNFFFIKALEQTKPGGLVSFFTTRSMIDNPSNQAFREYLVNNANLISVHRFDNKLFANAGTSVISDLIILQKPINTKLKISLNEQAFLRLSNYDDRYINEIFDTDQGVVIGETYATTGIAGSPTISVKRTSAFDQYMFNNMLAKDIKSLLGNYGIKQYVETERIQIEPSLDKNQVLQQEILERYPDLTPGNIVIADNKFYLTTSSTRGLDVFDIVPLTIKAEDHSRAADIVTLRQTYKAMRSALRKGNLEKAKAKQGELNQVYDMFNFRYGEINLAPNLRIAQKDVESDLLISLEIKGPKYYQQSAIFSQELTLEPQTRITLDSPAEAVHYCLSEFGEIKPEIIEKHLGTEWLKQALDEQLVFLDPQIQDFEKVISYKIVEKSVFVSGYVEGKHLIYSRELLNKNNPYYSSLNRNHIDFALAALSDHIPIKLSLDEINPSLGENWFPLAIYENFGKDLFDDPDFNIQFLASLDSFTVKGRYTSQAQSNYSVQRPSGRTISPHHIFEYCLQQSVPHLTTKIEIDGKERIVTDTKSIDAAILSFNKINTAFSKWIRQPSNTHLHNGLAELYHRKNNAVVKRIFDATDVTFTALANDIVPRALQTNCAWEITQNNGGIIDHKVGFGKTISMALCNNTKIKFGKIKKELLIALNANYVDVYNDFKTVYPERNYLLVTPEDLAPKNKQATFYKIANNDYDCIITAHSSLVRFPPSPETDKQIYQEMINEVQTIRDSDNILTRQQEGQLAKKLANAETGFQRALDRINERKTIGSVIWEDLGIDSITVDESQYFKNLTYETRHTRVAGLGTTKDTQKTTALLSYIRATQKLHHQRSGKWDQGVTFVSGTTISNSLTELYLLFKYLTPKYLESKNIHNFDQWARQYCRKDYSYETSLSGEVKLKERFRFFVKVPELANDYKRITNYADDNTFYIPKPKLKHNLVVVDPTPIQQNYFDRLKKFALTKNPEGIIGVNDNSKTRKAVGLICTSQGRKAALDMRLVDPFLDKDGLVKIDHMITDAVQTYHTFNDSKGTQLIFCDSGTPSGSSYNLYKAIKQGLIASGIPENEIAFIHSHNATKSKKQLFKNVNQGNIRFLLGSTPKLGVGVNVQEKLVKLHHLDWPWRPTDLDQRNGRGGRQGNTIIMPGKTMNVNYYATKGSLDAYTLNLIQIKANFINQIKNASISLREIDEGTMDNDGGMNAEQFMAALSENEYLNQKLIAEKKLEKILNLENAHKSKQRQNQWRIDDIKEQLTKAIKWRNNLNDDHPHFKSFEFDVDKSVFFVNDQKFIHAGIAGKTIVDQVIKQFVPGANWSDFNLKLNQGFSMQISPRMDDIPFGDENYKLVVKSPSGILFKYHSQNLVKDPIKNALHAYNAVKKIPQLLNDYDQKIENLNKDHNSYKQANEKGFDQHHEIGSLKKEIKYLDGLIKKASNQRKQDQNKEINTKNKGRNKGPKM